MRTFLRNALWGLLGLFILQFFQGCSGAVYVRPTPPPPRYEERGEAPFEAAVWVDGYWEWEGRGRGYEWREGHWKNVGNDERTHKRGHEKHEHDEEHGRN